MKTLHIILVHEDTSFLRSPATQQVWYLDFPYLIYLKVKINKGLNLE